MFIGAMTQSLCIQQQYFKNLQCHIHKGARDETDNKSRMYTTPNNVTRSSAYSQWHAAVTKSPFYHFTCMQKGVHT